jgi:hypothetical protein
MNLTEGQAMWVAGIIEGEGSIGWREGRVARIAVGMSDHDVIYRLHEWTGLGHVHPHPIQEAHHKPMLVWVVSAQEEFLTLAAAIEPHLLARRSARLREVRENLLEHQREIEAARLSRFIAGEGLCLHGHDRAVLGVYKDGKCAECNRERMRASTVPSES